MKDFNGSGMKKNIILIVICLLMTWPIWIQAEGEEQPAPPPAEISETPAEEYPLLIPPNFRNSSRESTSFFQINSNWEHDFSTEQKEVLERIDKFITDLEAAGIQISSEADRTDIAGFKPTSGLLLLLRELNINDLAQYVQRTARNEGMTSLILENTDIRDLPADFREGIVENGETGLGILPEDYHKISRGLWDTNHEGQADYEKILFDLFGEQQEPMEGLVKPRIAPRVAQFLIHNVCFWTLRRIPVLNQVFGGYFPLRNNYVLIPSTASRLDLFHMQYHLYQMMSSRWKFRNHAKAEGHKGKILVEMAAHLYFLKNYKAYGLSFPEVVKSFHELYSTLLHFEQWSSSLKLVRRTYGEPTGREKALELAHELNRELSLNGQWDLAIRVSFAKHDYWSYVGRLHTIFQAYGSEATQRFLMGDARSLNVRNRLGQIFAKEQEFELRMWFGLKNIMTTVSRASENMGRTVKRAIRRENIDRAQGVDPAAEEEKDREGRTHEGWGEGKGRKLPDVHGTHGPGRAHK